MKTYEVFHTTINIGETVALMIFAKYLKMIKNADHIVFNTATFWEDRYMNRSIKVETLFKDLIDEFIHDPDVKSKDREHIRKCPGNAWVATQYLVAKYGQQIMPKLNLDSSEYTGEQYDWNNYICFSPLWDGEYNPPRGMNHKFCNKLIDELNVTYRDNFYVITDKPNLVRNKKIKIIHTDNLYDIIYFISKSKVYIGGDTGFTHFAGLGRPRGLISIYEEDQFRHFNRMRHQGLYPNGNWNSDPVVDRSKTVHLHLNMINNALSNFKQIHHVINLIDEERICIEKGEWK